MYYCVLLQVMVNDQGEQIDRIGNNINSTIIIRLPLP